MTRLFTSESVTEGHPDKMCDKISDAILDDYLRHDPKSRVAVETCCTKGLVLVMGEVTSEYQADIPQIVRKTIEEIGYTDKETGFDAETCFIMNKIGTQSPDIAMGTNDERGGAGDQGMMFGYACDETPDLMPLPITLANRLAYRLTVARKSGAIPHIKPDGKTQVTVAYDENMNPRNIDTIVISTQHDETVTAENLREPLIENVVKPVIEELKTYLPSVADRSLPKLLINPTGRFVLGGPEADSGLTGRKIIVDTYGGYASHGGGAFSGKDPTKVDRSGAYAARYIAKNIVQAGLARKCQIQIAYAIGVDEPVSVFIDTYGTNNVDEQLIKCAVNNVFDLTPQGIIARLDLRRPIYSGTAAYGHFGKTTGENRPWEAVDAAAELREFVAQSTKYE